MPELAYCKSEGVNSSSGHYKQCTIKALYYGVYSLALV